MVSFQQRDASGSRICAVGTVIVNHAGTVYLQHASVVTGHEKLPDAVGRDVQVAGEYVSEVVFVGSALDGRGGHFTPADNLGGKDVPPHSSLALTMRAGSAMDPGGRGGWGHSSPAERAAEGSLALPCFRAAWLHSAVPGEKEEHVQIPGSGTFTAVFHQDWASHFLILLLVYYSSQGRRG